MMKSTPFLATTLLLSALFFSEFAATQTVEDESAMELAYAAASREGDPTGVDGRAALSLISAHSIRVSDERQTGAAYLRELRNRLTHDPDDVARWLGIGTAELRTLRKHLERIELENVALVRKRVEAMCEAWSKLPESMTELERANAALAHFTRLENAELYANSARQHLFQDLAIVLGDDAIALLRAEMYRYGETSVNASYSWESLVHSIGKQVEQVNFSCGLSAGN